MDVLVIGGAGQIGLELCRLLTNEDIPFQAPGRDELDLEKHRDVRRLIEKMQPSIVINTAGYRNAEKAIHEPSLCFNINRDAVANLAKACDKNGAALVQISSWRVFDGTKKDPYTEKDTPNPENVLGNSFWQGEQQIHQHCSRHIILRLSWIISHLGENRVTRVLDSFLDSEHPTLVRSHNKGNPTTAQEAARVLLAITKQLNCNINVWGTYHYNAAETIDERALAEVILAEASQYVDIKNRELPTSTDTEQTPVIRSTLDNTQLQNTFGIQPRPWRSPLARLVRDYFQNRSVVKNKN